MHWQPAALSRHKALATMWEKHAQRAARAAWRAFASASPTATRTAAQQASAAFRGAAQASRTTATSMRASGLSPLQVWGSMGKSPMYGFAATPVVHSPAPAVRPCSTQPAAATSIAVDTGDDEVGASSGSASSAPGMCKDNESPDTGQTCRIARRGGSTPGRDFNEPQLQPLQRSHDLQTPHLPGTFLMPKDQPSSVLTSSSATLPTPMPLPGMCAHNLARLWRLPGTTGGCLQLQQLRSMATDGPGGRGSDSGASVGFQQGLGFGKGDRRNPSSSGQGSGGGLTVSRRGGQGRQDRERAQRGAGGKGSGESGAGSAGRGSGGGGGGWYRPTLEDDVLELRVFAKDSFLQKQLPIPPGVREVMYAHRWDKLLVDTRRDVVLVKDKGKVELYTAMVAVGNMKGLLGLGLGEGPTAQEAVAAAHLKSFSNLQVVPLYRGHTIYHAIDHHYHRMKLSLRPMPAGRGIYASDLVTELCNLAGIRDIHVKIHAGNRSRLFVATAFMEALQKQAVPHDGVEGSGVYLREVYYKSSTPMNVSLPRTASSSSAAPAAVAA